MKSTMTRETNRRLQNQNRSLLAMAQNIFHMSMQQTLVSHWC
jgi:hypothetical protein